jgi:hypothetical protein
MLLALVTLSGCEQLARIGPADGNCVPPEVQAAFDRACARAGCHDATGAGAGLVLRAPGSADILALDATQRPLPLVLRGDLDSSYLAHKIMLDPPSPIVGARMPIGFNPDDPGQAKDVATILGWIAGADLPGCEAADGGTTEGDPTGGEVRDLPCEVDELLQARCRACHSDPPVGAPIPLVTRDDLLAASAVDPNATVADRVWLRMSDDASPMPPAPGARVTAEQIAAFEAWLDAGTPAGTCGSTGGPDPFAADAMCSSGVTWSLGDEGDPRMLPGRDCVTCHDAERLEDPDDDGIPDLVIGGTLYPTAHEPDDCYGDASADLRVIIASTSGGAEVTLAPNASGNFLLHRASAPAGFEPPFSVKVVQGDRERIMAIPATSGSCNECHTQDGTAGAPGRVVVP